MRSLIAFCPGGLVSVLDSAVTGECTYINKFSFIQFYITSCLIINIEDTIPCNSLPPDPVTC